MPASSSQLWHVFIPNICLFEAQRKTYWIFLIWVSTKPEYVQNFPYPDSVSHTTVMSITAYSSAILLVASIKRTCKNPLELENLICAIARLSVPLLSNAKYSILSLTGFKFAWLIENQHLSMNLVELILLENFLSGLLTHVFWALIIWKLSFHSFAKFNVAVLPKICLDVCHTNTYI